MYVYVHMYIHIFLSIYIHRYVYIYIYINVLIEIYTCDIVCTNTVQNVPEAFFCNCTSYNCMQGLRFLREAGADSLLGIFVLAWHQAEDLSSCGVHGTPYRVLVQRTGIVQMSLATDTHTQRHTQNP